MKIISPASFAKKTRLILDVDDTLLHWTSAFSLWMNNRGFFLDPKRSQNGALGFVGVTPRDLRIHIEQFNLTDHFGGLHPIDGAVEAVQRLQSSGAFDKTIAVSACGVAARTQLHRLLNLERLFYIDEFYALPLGASKRDVFENFPSSVVVDDMHHHVSDALDVGHLGFHFQHLNGDKWSDLVKEILNG